MVKVHLVALFPMALEAVVNSPRGPGYVFLNTSIKSVSWLTSAWTSGEIFMIKAL